MKKYERKTWIAIILSNLLISFTLAVLVDFCFLLFQLGLPWGIQMLTMTQFAAVFFCCFLLSFILSVFAGKKWSIFAGGFSAAIWLLLAVGALGWHTATKDLGYVAADDGKSALYSDRRVMLLVPHQDDDINVLGGVIEEYTKYGSEVYVVFSTNGDYYGEAKIRLKEAVMAMSAMGVPEDHVIFLGYGDRWDPEGPHLYNAEPGVVMTSAFGSTKTYGTDWHPAYREGNAYTADQFLEDIESVILEYRPDVLYCVDYDHHIDHKALMLAFEKVMGRILNTQEAYRPKVFKGYAYSTAWESGTDFYGENIKSTPNIFAGPNSQQPEIYRWEDRVRLPVHAENLSRSVVQSGAYDKLSIYASQNAGFHTDRVYKGDKVFWERRTDSLCYGAQIQASSGKAELLNNFMLLDNFCLADDKYEPYDGVWIPEAEDSARQIQVTFAQPETVTMVSLYDHPDPEKNVLDAVIRFDDGSHIRTGPLHSGGAESRFPVTSRTVQSFTVTLLEEEGKAGLTEVAAYGSDLATMPFIKLMDTEENFAYDYWIDPDGYQEFLLYTGAGMPAATSENYDLSCSNDNCSVSWQEDTIAVACPRGETCRISVASKDGKLADTVLVQNPGSWQRNRTKFWSGAEEKIINICMMQELHEHLMICRLYTRISQKLESLFY